MTRLSSISACSFDSSNQSNLNQHLGVLLISLSGFALGVTLAWNSSISNTLRNVLNASSIEMKLIESVVNVGACGGVLILPCVLKSLSRTTIMVSTTPIYLIGWAFICLGDRKMWPLEIGRFLCGLSGGISCVTTPIFVSEIADKKSRARSLTYFQLCINIGIFYAFLAKYLLNDDETIWKYSLISAISCAPIVFIYMIPETPLYYLMRNDETNADRSIRWYDGVRECQRNYQDLLRINSSTEYKTSRIKILKNRHVILSIVVCHGVIIFQQMSCINPLIFNMATIFDNCSSGYLTSDQLSVIIAAIQVISCLICTLFVEWLGKQILLIVSEISMGTFLIILGCYFSVRDNDPEFYEEIYGWMPPTWIALFFASFNLGLGPISWSILGDTLPNEIKTFTIVSVIFLSWLLSFIMTSIFSELVILLGIPHLMWLLGSFCWLGAIFCSIFIQESGDRSLTDIQDNSVINISVVKIDTKL